MAERGVVLCGTGGVWSVRTTNDGETREARLRGRLKQVTDDGNTVAVKLAVGDEVILEPADRGDGWLISDIVPRRSKLARRAPGGAIGERIVVANVDQVVVVFAAAKPEPVLRMLDRFLVIAEGNALAARVVINKVDLVGEATARARFADYERIGYPVHYTSVSNRGGLVELGDALRARTSALSGPSGVGKSSLMNALYPGLDLRVGAISESVQKGRHTTVGALLHPLPDGGFVADTPGLREVGLWGLAPEHLDQCFPEMRQLIGQCRFADCTHLVEPECAIREALERGEVAPARYDSYAKLREELAEATRIW
jgi:ribosome biogenesis GTPase / thiamine phosphate phosphatase